MSLQYLKKEVRKGVHFLHADEHQSFYKLRLFLMEVAIYIQSTQKRKLVIFLQSVAAAFVFYCDAKHSDILFIYDLSYIQLTNFFAQPDCRNFLPEHCNTKLN